MIYKCFIFKNYSFNPSDKTLILEYSLDDQLAFSETYKFEFDFVDYDAKALDRALQNLFFMAGVSYYKTFVPSEITIEKGNLDANGARFFSKTYQKGLGEFFYVNGLNPNSEINFPYTSLADQVPVLRGKGQLVGLGGGKDSLVSVEILKEYPNVATWSLGHRKQLDPLVKKVGLPHFWVLREWDKSLLELNKNGAYNGHIPISAILACVGTVVAVLTGYQDVVVSNESSSSEPNLTYQGIQINHQYSKSLEFEQDFQELLSNNFAGGMHYYSLLRPLTELRIAEIFSKIAFEKYKDVFSSCNRAFVHNSPGISWCGECPKCAFVFLALTPFVKRERLETLFGGKNLLLDPALENVYRQLLGIEGDKPMECVGEIKESRAAMRLSQDLYPELNKYKFDLPDNYNFRGFGKHAIPDDVFKILQTAVLPL